MADERRVRRRGRGRGCGAGAGRRPSRQLSGGCEIPQLAFNLVFISRPARPAGAARDPRHGGLSRRNNGPNFIFFIIFRAECGKATITPSKLKPDP
ncbi:hypothetical protein EVAR_10766_1 [Eumeta japonica]|uniref:Uncharacterized protein n=1 Tax=Eumeta variegata TaxID=151549 RepID=A0A4C1W622_EUMVA|nr:hypothetical protein EVAR_10766_1 [Eumeta japonica]